MYTKKVEIFTDGSCLGNPGPGGYGAILHYAKYEKKLSAGYYITTNNRMELMAAIIALEILKDPCSVKLYSDSQYVRKGITNWIHHWKRRGWKTTNKRSVKNIDLWQRLDLIIQIHQIEWIWIKGHSNCINNIRCDELARKAACIPNREDFGYNKNNK